jgi:hypothetical protein
MSYYFLSRNRDVCFTLRHLSPFISHYCFDAVYRHYSPPFEPFILMALRDDLLILYWSRIGHAHRAIQKYPHSATLEISILINLWPPLLPPVAYTLCCQANATTRPAAMFPSPCFPVHQLRSFHHFI